MAVPVIDNLLAVITEGIKYLTLLTKTSHVRKLRKAVDYGEQFIQLFDELVAEEDVKKKQQIRVRMNVIAKRFFKYNQG